ncbi:uncharacterized protein [Drosophila kikkawai]|uniref:Transcription elongation factor, mitochondrial n=1 Tax=Drosophila kikkawai TaxID=30033 RepID=A0A6P4I6C9_DROKI|nr:uncharacterized protein LOC108072658 [Drosophila kikkawai]KAH8322009.1 hypothetical protein KR059_000384 [Drosophila kikkawai]
MLSCCRAVAVTGRSLRWSSITSAKQHGTEQDSSHNILPAYSDDQRLKILEAINGSCIDQMLNFDITKARAAKLQNWKTRYGPMKELGEILHIEGFSLKVATKLFKSLLEQVDGVRSSEVVPGQEPKASRTAPFITPAMDDKRRLQIVSSIGVRIGVTSVSWARMEIGRQDSSCRLTNWQHHELNDKKMHLAELVQRCLYATHQIPQADCYVLESPQMAQVSNNPGSIDQQNVNIQKAQVSAIMSYALMSRMYPDDNKAKNVYYMRRFLTARLFNHLVGTERVTSEETILAMMRNDNYSEYKTSDTQAITLLNQVHFPADLRQLFSQLARHQRDFLGQAFLLNLAFIRLVLLRDPTSITSVSRHSKSPRAS